MPKAVYGNHADASESLTTTHDQSAAMKDLQDANSIPTSTGQEEETKVDEIKESEEVENDDKETTPVPDAPVPPEVETSSPTHPSGESDTASVHSAPVAHAFSAPTTNARPSTAHSRDSSALMPAAVSRIQRTTETTVSTGERANRHRSALESRASNRLSGFFSSLIHRRDAVPNPPSRSGLREERGASPGPRDSSSHPGSRSASPAPARPVTPPPPLPPPTLQELGLTLSALTGTLSPSHFSTPPSSGAFLAPHYLLLCHAQGLDVLPLISPPAPQPYALVRRVSFKSVVVMEQRGVLVAIAGRRDGVRVYALEEVKKAVEWRIEVEVRRERERARREEAKKAAARPIPNGVILDPRDSSEKAKAKLLPPLSTSLPLPTSTPPPNRNKLSRRASQSTPVTATPRTPTSKKSRPTPPPIPAPAPQPRTPTQEPTGLPPPYSNSPESRPLLRSSPSVVSLARSRRPSVSQVLGAAPPVPKRKSDNSHDPDSKAEDWIEGRGSSDDEAIDIVAAGASGGQALDERTSARHSVPSPSHGIETTPITLANSGRSPSAPSTRRNRPANLDLSLTRANTNSVAAAPPSPTPTLLDLRQALQHAPPLPNAPSTDQRNTETPEPDDEEEAPSREVSLAQMLMESRIPDLPPVGTRQPQQPIILGGAAPVSPGRSRVQRPSSPPDEEDEDEDAPTRGVSLAQMLMESRIPDLPPAGSRQVQQPIILGENDPPASPTSSARPSTVGRSDTRRRRRWSVLDGFFSDGSSAHPPAVSASSSTTLPSTSETAVTSSTRRDRRSSTLLRSNSSRRSSSATRLGSRSTPLPPRPSSAGAGGVIPSDTDIPPVPSALTISSSGTPSHSRFIPRIISNAFSSRRSDDQPQALSVKSSDTVDGRKTSGNTVAGHAPPPKLEYVKLPGTKGALMIKSVETAKKSFLAILCGDNGEKVELFAGTYRTALGLSRTFILPDSPRSLELQLQGDDLVEVFLVFAQNVFGLEPATVRVREVRIGRAERRAARRRAREIRSGSGSADVFDTDPPAGEDEDTNVSINIGVSVAAGADPVINPGDTAPPMSPPSTAQTPEAPHTPADAEGGGGSGSALAHAEELVALAAAQIGPYTTFQQLSFAPNFPLASIADEYIIPPTYPDFLGYRAEHEPEVNGTSNVDLALVQFSPPGLPAPAAAPPSKWFYRDPKNVVHGPWKASLMQAWYKDGLLPPDLPVRREEDADYVQLKDLRLQSVDPTHPFRSLPPPMQIQPLSAFHDAKPLLQPLSLLSQPRHYGPPALFFSSRGGHSTTIVDARGRSVLKGRFVWSSDEHDDDKPSLMGKMGDVKRLEAFDVDDRSVIVAMRHGGLEAMDLGDALLKPADESRTILPQFTAPPSNTNRRGPFVWRIGTPITSSLMSSAALSNKSKGLSTPSKKHHVVGKSPSKSDFPGDSEADGVDEVMFLGRTQDDIYLCERNAGTFRILHLCPKSISTS